jgi:hypothetical protein
MQTDALGTVSFAYGDGSDVTAAGQAPLDGTGYDANGTIRIVVPRSAFGLSDGQELTQFLVRVRLEASLVGALTPDNMPDSTARAGGYTLVSGGCRPPQPDLLVQGSDIAVSKVQGHQETISGLVHNVGNADAERFGVVILVDGVQAGGVQYVSRIVPGGSARVSVGWDVSHLKGQHTITVTANPDGALAESSTDNDSGSRIVTVQGSKVS